MNSTQDQIFINRLNQHPKLRERVDELLKVVENAVGEYTKADAAEQHIIEELRKLGNEALHSWAENAVQKTTETLRHQEPKLHGNGKKKVSWHTTFGEISVLEPIFRGPGQPQFRPFLTAAKITSRCCSMPLQRVMTDFGADHAFGQVPNKLREHYGIEMPDSTIRKVTEFHAQQLHIQREEVIESLNSKGCAVLIAEMDGCMLPMVKTTEKEGDKRKHKTLYWQEARLALAHEPGSTTPKFAATFGGSVEEAGQALWNCAVAAGFGASTQLHSVGDGATWIAAQVERQFGAQGYYLLDFYHVCEYLGAAANSCAPANPHAWLETQKKLLKNNDYQVVIHNLKGHLEDDAIPTSKAPVRACHRYLSHRTDQLDYKGAIDQNLPIGSGEIESAHRYVIQERLKLPGAWWKAANAETMLTLRTVRANGKWDDYWGNLAEAA